MMIAKQAFGRTGHMSTRTIFGAAALGNVTQSEADQTLEVLLKYGVNHIDTAASYGESELRIGPWMDRYRKQFFLATKTGERTYQKARDQIHASLDRLHTDHIDLIQLHFLVDIDEWKTAMGPGGALEAILEARDQKLVSFIGVTGHEIAVAERHMQSLQQAAFDSVLLPYSYIMMQNPHYAENFEKLFRLCQEQNIAVQTIKSLTRRPWAPHIEHKFASTWYEPFTEQVDIDRAVSWVLGRPGVFLNTIGDIHILPKVLDAASRFTTRPSDEAMAAMHRATEAAPLFT